jgi:Ca-activated chloride channel family protein
VEAVGMNFAALNYIWVCILTIILFTLGFYLQRKRQAQLSSWIKFDFWHQLIPEYSKKKFNLKWLTLAFGLIFILIATLRPQWGEKEDTIESKGMDLIFILDLSNSMQAEDVNPSRLQRAQSLIKKTLSPDCR